MLPLPRALLVPAVFLVLLATCVAADPTKVFTDPAQTGPDFAVQGEYVGDVKIDGGPARFGVQIIALGDGKFRGATYPGGLPGDGWDRRDPIATEGERKGDFVTFVAPGSDLVSTVKDGQIVVRSGDNTIATFKKVERKSSTLGAKPPAGAAVLFDGTTPDKFLGGRMTKDGLLMEGATSKQKFQSFTIHLEFRLPFQPYDREQGRGNSGFYAQGRYEVQILDSFGLSGEDNECGGIYKVARPEVNMCYPPLSWQTYDVEFAAAEFKDGKKVKNARMTVRHNGMVIHKDREIPHTTVGAIVKDEGPEPGPIYLQNHGNPVRFRNIGVSQKRP